MSNSSSIFSGLMREAKSGGKSPSATSATGARPANAPRLQHPPPVQTGESQRPTPNPARLHAPLTMPPKERDIPLSSSTANAVKSTARHATVEDDDMEDVPNNSSTSAHHATVVGNGTQGAQGTPFTPMPAARNKFHPQASASSFFGSSPAPAFGSSNYMQSTPASSAPPSAGAMPQGQGTQNDPSTPTPAERPKLQPKRQQDCHREPLLPKRDFLKEIVYEVASEDSPLPEGYLGTFRRERWVVPDYNACLDCGLANEHRLVCGHWVKSAEPCGMNCKTEILDHAPFICPTCHDGVKDVLENKITPAQKAKLTALRGKDEAMAVGCCVEYVSQYAPELKGNVTETVLSYIRPNWGRACVASEGPAPVVMPSFEDMIIAEQERHEHKQWEKFVKKYPLIKHEKRKDRDDADEQGSTKKQKQKPETLHDLIPLQKRKAEDDDGTSKKKQKQKLETHREPITLQTHGNKRPLRSPFTSYSNPLHPCKKVALTARSKDKEVSFATPYMTPYKSSPPPSLEPLVKERGADAPKVRVVKLQNGKRRRS